MGHVTPNELPDFWQAFVPIDYMFVSAAELKSIQANLPTTWNAIREWVVAEGGWCWLNVAPVAKHFRQLNVTGSIWRKVKSEICGRERPSPKSLYPEMTGQKNGNPSLWQTRIPAALKQPSVRK